MMEPTAAPPPQPTYATLTGVASVNSVYAGDDCDPGHIANVGDIIEDSDCWGCDGDCHSFTAGEVN